VVLGVLQNRSITINVGALFLPHITIYKNAIILAPRDLMQYVLHPGRTLNG
jgi:hypothetical protein